jgi:hypothetical protein
MDIQGLFDEFLEMLRVWLEQFLAWVRELFG